jgi:uncharacterized protein YggE
MVQSGIEFGASSLPASGPAAERPDVRRRGHLLMLRPLVAIVVLIVASVAYGQPVPSKPHIYVEGSAEIDVEPDLLVAELLISSVNSDVSVSKSDVDQRSRQLIAASKALGVSTKQISATNLSISPAYSWSDNERKFEGTRVSRQIEITLSDLSLYSELIQAIVAANVNEIVSTRLESTSSKELEDKALQAALADARTRAERLAESAGRRLGPVYSITEFHLRDDYWRLNTGRMTVAGASESIVHKRSVSGLAMASDDPFTPGLLHARATVYVVFELKK